ncbi:hypothetical protein Dimus_039222 [Dionaea muscipula]
MSFSRWRFISLSPDHGFNFMDSILWAAIWARFCLILFFDGSDAEMVVVVAMAVKRWWQRRLWWCRDGGGWCRRWWWRLWWCKDGGGWCRINGGGGGNYGGPEMVVGRDGGGW